MSKYTTEVRHIVEQATQDYYNLTLDEKIKLSLPIIFNFNYPIWDIGYKSVLEEKIIRHYFTKEICFETVGLWKFILSERLNLIMPYYNELYKTIIDYDFLVDTNIVEEYKGNNVFNGLSDSTSKAKQESNQTSNNTETSTSDTSENGKNLLSDLPQVNYNNIDYGTNLTETNNNSVNNISSTNDIVNDNIVKNDSNNTSTTKSTNNDENIKTTKGHNNHTIAELINQYRDSLLNIDNMIINDLKDLFMMIY